MKNDLYERLKEYNESDFIRFHMPGHKGRSNILNDAYGIDVTELDISDNLNYPEEILRDAEKHACDIFGAEDTIFTVNGSSAAIMAAIMYCVKSKEKLLLPYDCHISCYHGAMHSGCEIVRCEVNDNIRGITLDEIKNAVENNPDIKACVITSPTYFGFSVDIKAITEYLHEKNIILIADESHGTHFALSDNYPMSAIKAEADFVVHSAHKSIGALTQTAMLHINNRNIDSRDVRFYLRSVQSTSPSYVLICSIIEAIKNLKNADEVLEDVRMWYNNISEMISPLGKLKMLRGNNNNTDYMKICIQVLGDTDEFVQMLRDEYRIIPEMVYENKVVFMAGLYSRKEDYSRLAHAIMEAEKRINPICRESITSKMPRTKARYSIKEAMDMPKEYIELSQSEGRVSADYVNVYPPGAPCLIPGEIITQQIIGYIRNSENVVGIQNNKIKAVK